MSKVSYAETLKRGGLEPPDEEGLKRHYAYNYEQLLPADPDSRIVELGCGEGFALSWLLDRGYARLTGVDNDERSINRARVRLEGRLPTDGLVCAHVLEHVSECETDSVDAVVMFNLIEHIEKAALLALIADIHRILKPGGGFLSQTGNIENPFNYGLFARDFTHHIPFTTNSLRQAMILGGFAPNQVVVRPVRYRTTLRNLPLQITGPVMGLLLKALARSMRTRIRETCPLIYSLARKES